MPEFLKINTGAATLAFWHIEESEEQLKAEGVTYKVGQFAFRALGRARASMDTDGFVKILADTKTDEVLGVHIIGARAADMIAEAVTAMEFKASEPARAAHRHAHLGQMSRPQRYEP